MYVSTFVCMCISVYMCVCMYVCIYVWNVHVCWYMSLCMCMYECAACMYACDVCVCLRKDHASIHTYIYVYEMWCTFHPSLHKANSHTGVVHMRGICVVEEIIFHTLNKKISKWWEGSECNAWTGHGSFAHMHDTSKLSKHKEARLPCFPKYKSDVTQTENVGSWMNFMHAGIIVAVGFYSPSLSKIEDSGAANTDLAWKRANRKANQANKPSARQSERPHVKNSFGRDERKWWKPAKRK